MKLYLFLVIAISLLSSCDPGLNGTLRVFNRSSLPLTVVTFEHSGSDSLVYTLQPNTDQAIKVLGGLGDQRSLDCCPCELQDIRIRTINGPIHKDPNNKDNWVIPNKSKQKRYGGEDLKCEFYVGPSDI